MVQDTLYLVFLAQDFRVAVLGYKPTFGISEIVILSVSIIFTNSGDESAFSTSMCGLSYGQWWHLVRCSMAREGSATP